MEIEQQAADCFEPCVILPFQKIHRLLEQAGDLCPLIFVALLLQIGHGPAQARCAKSVQALPQSYRRCLGCTWLQVRLDRRQEPAVTMLRFA